MQILNSSDIRKLIQEKIMLSTLPSILEEVLNQSNQQLLSCPNHYSKIELQQAIEYLSSNFCKDCTNVEDIDTNIPKMLQL
jgi:hypothetical protein